MVKLVKFTYRPEIDGLRAFAVIVVVLFHSEFIFFDKILFSGGFIGVDIFFVISGYLISSIIIKEISLTNNFSFLNFYERRARRILPILFLILSTSLLLSYFLLSPGSSIQLAVSTLYSIAFSSNIHFWLKSIEYGAATGFQIPLLHTWSLSVEEQFYLIFPILFFISLKYIKKKIILIITFLIILNLLIIQFGGNFNLNSPFIEKNFKFEAPTFFTSFLMTLSRPWELLIGVLISLIESKYGRYKGNIFFSNIMSFTALIIIIYAIFNFDNEMFYPSFFTLIPVIGTGIIIYFCNDENIVTRIFSLKYFVSIGLISYSLYLWHYIVLVFYRLYFITDKVEHKIELILFSIILSFFTYRYIETPFRNFKIIKTRSFLIYISLTLFTLVSLSFLIIFKDGFYNKLNNKYIVSGVNIDNRFLGIETDKYYNKIGIPSFTNKQSQKVLIIGNSLGRDLYVGFKLNHHLYNNFEFSFWDTSLYCLNDYISKNIDKVKCNLDKKNEENLKKADIIFISTRWISKDLDGLNNTILRLKNEGKKIVLSSYRPKFDVIYNFTYLDKFLLKNKRFPNAEETDYLEKLHFNFLDKIKIKKINNFLKDIAYNNNIIYIDFSKLFCSLKEKKCKIFDDNNKKLFLDWGHLTLEGSKYINKKILLLDIFK